MNFRGLAVLAAASVALSGCAADSVTSSPSSSSAFEDAASNSVSDHADAPGIGSTGATGEAADADVWYLIAPSSSDAQSLIPDLVASIEQIAQDRGDELTVLTPDDDHLSSAVTSAVSAAPDLVIAATPALLEEVSYTAAENLGQRFLLIDAQPPEPTENLTSLIFDKTGCPDGATCLTSEDIYDPMILRQDDAPDLTAAIASTIDRVTEESGTISLVAVSAPH